MSFSQFDQQSLRNYFGTKDYVGTWIRFDLLLPICIFAIWFFLAWSIAGANSATIHLVGSGDLYLFAAMLCLGAIRHARRTVMICERLRRSDDTVSFDKSMDKLKRYSGEILLIIVFFSFFAFGAVKMLFFCLIHFGFNDIAIQMANQQLMISVGYTLFAVCMAFANMHMSKHFLLHP